MHQLLTMSNKVLLALYRLSRRGHKKVRYEDIVVQVFKDYPAEFHLKGYLEYPDSGDAVHKPLYDYRQKGMVTASNKMFSLTEHGLTEAKRLLAIEAGKTPVESAGRLERSAQIEVDRIRQLESFKLFLAGRDGDIIDSDLFDYLGVSVRTTRSDFIGRLEAMRAAVESATAGRDDPTLGAVRRFHDFLMSKFKNEIDFKTRTR